MTKYWRAFVNSGYINCWKLYQLIACQLLNDHSMHESSGSDLLEKSAK
jgi:hypothetical protein